MVKDKPCMVPLREVVVTLVGLRQAKEGLVFFNIGPLKECQGCKIFNVCMGNLEQRRVYTVTGIRSKTFKCKIHEEGVRVVEVKLADIEALIEKRLAFEGATITFIAQECEDQTCPNYRKCIPYGLNRADKCKVLKVGEDVNCLLGRSLIASILRPLSGASPS